MVSYEKTFFIDSSPRSYLPSFPDDEAGCLDGHSAFEILLGKEKAVFNHSGNKRFRSIVNHNVHDYMTASKKSMKTKLVRKVHNEMQEAGFRFLKNEQSAWRDIDENDAREKVSHALRDRVREMRRPTKRPKRSSEDVYPMIISMAKVIKENQALLQEAMPCPPKIEWSNGISPITKSLKNVETKSNFSGSTNLLDIIDSIQTKSLELSGAKRMFSVSNVDDRSSKKLRRSLNLSTDIQEEVGTRPRSMSMDSLFDGLADEIADAQTESYSLENDIQDIKQRDDELPMKFISIEDDNNRLIDEEDSAELHRSFHRTASLIKSSLANPFGWNDLGYDDQFMLGCENSYLARPDESYSR